MSLKRFTNPKNLRGLGKPLLTTFFDKFKTELAASKVKLPDASTEDDAYFNALAKVFLSPTELPDEMVEVLYAVVEMADDSGQERLQLAVKEKNLALEVDEHTSHMDYAMRVWLADKELLMAKHGEHRLVRVTSFQYFGTKTAVGSRLPFKAPPQAAIDLVRDEVDKWCAAHNRGSETARVRMQELDGEWWFPIQHGGTVKRESKVEKRKVQTLHFRPGQDAVVVYCPARDEIRVHADTKGERVLYQEHFGKCLRGDDRYFSEKKCFTLDPLREDVDKALNPKKAARIKSITLQELEISFGGTFGDSTVRKSKDIVASAAERSKKKDKPVPAVPAGGKLVRATFELEFTGSKKPRKVHVRPPDMLKLGRHCDARPVHEWLSECEFRAVAKGKEG